MMSNLSEKRKRRYSAGLPYVLLALAPLCWAGNIVLARGVVDLIPPVAFAFWRWTLAFLILLPFTWRHVKRDWSHAIQSWKIMGLLSIFGISCFNTMLYTAVHTTTAINGALIQTAMPAFIILISLAIYREKVTLLQIAGVAVCIGGACLVILRGRLDTLRTLSFAWGDILVTGAVILYALYSALLRQRPAIHPLSFLTVTFGLGVLGLLPMYIWESIWIQPFAVTREAVFSVLFVALFPSIVAYFCWNRGIEALGANRAGLFINLNPVFTSLMAVPLLGESLRGFHLVGMILIFSGMLLFNRRP